MNRNFTDCNVKSRLRSHSWVIIPVIDFQVEIVWHVNNEEVLAASLYCTYKENEHKVSWPTAEARPEPEQCQAASSKKREPPLPRAQWTAPLPYIALNELQYTILKKQVTKVLHLVLNVLHYDSVSNFIIFYDKYRQGPLSLKKFFDSYDPPLVNGKLTCVGQSLTLVRLIKKLDDTFPGIKNSTSILSCQESVEAPEILKVTSVEGPYALENISGEKEHVVVGVRFKIGDREGIMIADPGYHLGTVVTIMKDKKSPHTGLFALHNTFMSIKLHNYTFNLRNDNYIEWFEEDYRKKSYKAQTSLIYAERPFINSIAVTEKRNLAYTFKSWLKRDPKGNVMAGIYFPLNPKFEEATFTVIIGFRAKVKFLFQDFLDIRDLPEDLLVIFDLLSKTMDCSKILLLTTIRQLAIVMSDKEFIEDIIILNSEIKNSFQQSFNGQSKETESTNGT